MTTPEERSSVNALKDAWNGTVHSEARAGDKLFDERWERSAENLTIMFTTGIVFGGIVSTLLFRGSRMRALGTGFGAGCGVGSSWTTIRYKIYGDDILQK